MKEYDIIKLPEGAFLNRKSSEQRTLKIHFLEMKPTYPEEGGIITFRSDFMKYPMRGYPFEEIREKVDCIKRAIVCVIRFITNKPIRYLIPFLAILPRGVIYKISYKALEEFICFSDKILYYDILNPKLYCRSGREIYRVIKEIISREKDEEKRIMLIEALLTLCMVWEFETSYRFRGQDIFGEIDKKSIMENPTKEIMRVLDIFLKREEIPPLKIKWRAIRFILFWLMITNKIPNNIIKEFFSKLDLEKIKLDKADLCYAYLKVGYKFGGKTHEEGLVEREKL